MGKCSIKMRRLLPKDGISQSWPLQFSKLEYWSTSEGSSSRVPGTWNSWLWLWNGYCLTLPVICATAEAKSKHGNLSWHCLSVALDSSLMWWKGLDLPQRFWNPQCAWVTVAVVMHGPTLWKLVNIGPRFFQTKQKEAFLTWMKEELCC